MNIEQRLAAMELAVARAEKRNTALLLLVAVLAIGLLAGFARKESAPPDELRAKSFIVVDAAGNTRAEVKATKEGASFELHDAQGVSRLVMTVDHFGPRIALQDEKEQVRGQFASLGLGPALDLGDGQGHTVATLNASADGPILSLKGIDGTDAYIAAYRKSAHLHLGNGDKKGSANIISADDGSGLILADDVGNRRVFVMAKKKESSMSIDDAAGKIVWRVP